MIELTPKQEHVLHVVAKGVVTHVVAHRTVTGAANLVPTGEGVSYPGTIRALVDAGLIELGDLEPSLSWAAYHSRGRRITLTAAGRAEAEVPRWKRENVRTARRKAAEWAAVDVAQAHPEEYEEALARRLSILGVGR